MVRKTLFLIIVISLMFSTFFNIEISYGATTEKLSISYHSHIQNIGWEKENSKVNGQMSGTEGQGLRLEAIKINLDNAATDFKIKYQTHVQNIGWQNWVENGKIAGTEGQGLRLEAIRIKLEGTKKYKLKYRVHIQNIGWQSWKEDGEIAGTENRSLRVEAIEIKVVFLDDISVEYNSHISKLGWEKSFSKINGQTSGTVGKALGLEAIQIRLKGVDNNANIQYQTHVQNIGWQNWNNEQTVAGTTNKSLNIEAIKIKLNNMSDYSVKYRVHIQNIGWQQWKKDGQIAGTTGKSLRIEAIEIIIIEKTQDIESGIKNGIDVSVYQGKIDWKKVKEAGIDFAIIRAGYRGYGVSSDGINGKIVQDARYIENIQNAINNNIDVGVYFFTQAINEKEAIEEANYVLSLVKNYKLTYPIAIDTELSSHPTGNGRADNLSVAQRTKIVKAFCETIENAGYEAMIYANKWWLRDDLNMNELSKYPVWLAHYTGATQDNPFLKPSDYKGDYVMWQYTDKGTVDGIVGNVDMNVHNF